MSGIYHFLAGFAQTWGLVYFCLVFVGIVLFVMRRNRKQHYEELARMPLRED